MTGRFTAAAAMKMKKKRTKIRERIFSVFFIMLLVAFSLTGFIFNIIVRQYIQITAGLQLDGIHNNILRFMESDRIHIIRPNNGPPEIQLFDNWQDSFAPLIRADIRININAIVVDSNYNLINDHGISGSQTVSEEAAEILKILKNTNRNISALRNTLIRTAAGAYYVTAFPAPGSVSAENIYFIIHADVTGLLFFAAMINTFLVILVCIMFVISIAVTFFLSKSITNPIKKLGLMATRIGQGDFTPGDFKFKDEEFENLNTALNNSAKQLSVYDSEQKKFFQNVSHELRTPLMSIQCQAEGILYGIMDTKNASGTILEETRRLSDLVTELLYISKIDNITPAYEKENANLAEILRSCAQRQQSVAERQGIRITFDPDNSVPEYECAPQLISRAADNLISNAVRYAKSEIIMTLEKTQDWIKICVADDGEGINRESMPYIFDRFYKSSGGNYGIGLSIVKSIIEQHHGTVTAENRENGGAVFTILLPAQTRK